MSAPDSAKDWRGKLIAGEDIAASVIDPANLRECDWAPSIFRARTAIDWMADAASRPLPRELLSSLVFEGEVVIFFGDTNTGKSVAAVQIADAWTSGRDFKGFTTDAEAEPTLYFDFELSDLQFVRRYSLEDGGRIVGLTSSIQG